MAWAIRTTIQGLSSVLGSVPPESTVLYAGPSRDDQSESVVVYTSPHAVAATVAGIGAGDGQGKAPEEVTVRFILYDSLIPSEWRVLAVLPIPTSSSSSSSSSFFDSLPFLAPAVRDTLSLIARHGPTPLQAVLTVAANGSTSVVASLEASSREWYAASAETASALAALVGGSGSASSPLYVYSLPTVANQLKKLTSKMPVDRLFYALKANWHPALLAEVEAHGVGFECVSWAEIRHVLALFPQLERSRILFTPNFCARCEYEWAFEAGVHVTLDNCGPLLEYPEVFAGRRGLVLRLDPGGQGAGHHEKVRTAGKQSKFGISIDAGEDGGDAGLERVVRECAAIGCTITGLHAHVGSGVTDPQFWINSATTLAALVDSGLLPDVASIDIGGGLGIDAGDAYLDDLAEGLRAWKRARETSGGAGGAGEGGQKKKLQIWMEPGRFVCSDAGILLATVTQVKQKGDRAFVGIDAGMNSLIRPALYNAHHNIVNLSSLLRHSKEKPQQQRERELELAVAVVDVVGPICETGDVIGFKRTDLADTRPGDVLCIANAGAYGRVMSSFYNLRAPAREVVITGSSTS
eukprot:ANDGO_00485.mRNA.1 Diaminopimelate decarboxylase